MKPTILHLTPFFSPNIGGVETHLTDLTTTLIRLGYQNYVLTYSPLTTSASYDSKETPSRFLTIRRFRWFGHNLFHRLETYPLLNFLYLTPYLFFRSLFWLLYHRPHIDVLHTHGLNAAIIGILLQKVFRYPRHLVSIYSAYDHVPLNSFSLRLLVNVLNHTDIVLTQSLRSLKQLQSLGVQPHRLHRYRHWIDTSVFTPATTLPSQFTILFVGRLIPGKNALTLAKIAPFFPTITFRFIGTGPDYPALLKLSQKHPNIILPGDIPYRQLHLQYQLASLLCIPSVYDEGWGRVIMEAISCGLPVIASNYGAIPEVIDQSIGLIINPTHTNIKSTISRITQDHALYTDLQKNCRSFALKHFSQKNISLITRFYIKT